MSFKNRLAKLEKMKSPDVGLADRLAEARRRPEGCRYRFRSREELEHILAISRNEMTLRLARAEIRLLGYSAKALS